jgi:hypothetical protein
MALLRAKNGFYAFESALRVRPAGRATEEIGLEEWNAPGLWRAGYGGLADRCLFFAEDLFGVQFCLHGGTVMSFDPETGEKTFIAEDVAAWAARLLREYDVLTGHGLAHDWQAQHGRIPSGHQLIPKIPFVLGGEFTIENLFLLDAAKAMRSRASLAMQIKDLPDGTKIEFKVVD